MKIRNITLALLCLGIFLLVFSNFSRYFHLDFPIKPMEVKQRFSLEGIVDECSGLCYSKDGLWMLNDGGNNSEVFLLKSRDYENWIHLGESSASTNMQLQRFILPVKNRDWEAIECDGIHLYIGEFGNNNGNRKDLRVYKVNIEAMKRYTMLRNAGIKDSMNPLQVDTIGFEYNNQRKFTRKKLQNFDCESMIFAKDSLYLFTKNWKNFQSNVYRIPAKKGDYVAQKIGQFNPGHLLTDASLLGEWVYFSGYTVMGAQRFSKVHFGTWTEFQTEQIKLKPAQVEGIFVDGKNKKVVFSTEKRKTQNAELFIGE